MKLLPTYNHWGVSKRIPKFKHNNQVLVKYPDGKIANSLFNIREFNKYINEKELVRIEEI